MLAQITLTEAAGILLSLLMAIAVTAFLKIGLPIYLERWERLGGDAVSSDSLDDAAPAVSADTRPLRHAAPAAPADFRPLLLTLLAIHAGKQWEAGKPAAGNGAGNGADAAALHIIDKGLTKGQWAQLEDWVRGGKKGLTQREIAAWMGKRDSTVGEAVRTIEQRIVQERQASAPTESVGPDFPPPPDAPAPPTYVSPVEFMAQTA